MKSKRSPSRHRKGGFTLIELLVVLAVVILLVLIGLPAVNKARERAASAKCLSNLRQYGAAIVALAADHDGLPPYSGDYNFGALLVPNYLSKALRCPLKLPRDGGYYTGNRCVAFYHPKLNGFSIPAWKMLLAVENYHPSAMWSTTHLRITVEDREQNHGTVEVPALHIFFVDGHASRFVSPGNKWSEPEGLYIRDPSTTDKSRRN